MSQVIPQFARLILWLVLGEKIDINIQIDDNDGWRPVAWLPELRFRGARDVVVQVINDTTSEILYTIRAPGRTFRPPVFAPGRYSERTSRSRPA